MVRSHQAKRRIVITGMGVVSVLGRTTLEFWRGLTERRDDSGGGKGQSSIGRADFAGSIEDFGELPDELRRSIRKALKLMNRETQMGVAAGQRALLESGILECYEPERIGVCFGADNVSLMPEDFQSGVEACTNAQGEFDVGDWGHHGVTEVAPLWLLKCLPNMPACHLAILNDLRGPSNTITQRDVAANLALAEACRVIQDEESDAMLVGGSGTLLPVFNLMHARLEDEVSQGDSLPGCPFDKRHTGPTPGEGAGAVVVEELRAALSRGATIYGEILGAGSVSLIGHDGAAACGRALNRAMRRTLERSPLTAEALGHLHAHGLGSKASDVAEARAICDVFGRRIPVVASKSHLAHAGAGSGALELIASLLALREGTLFPARNFRELDPECPIRLVTTNGEPAGTSFLNVNIFGRGLASCVAVGAYQG